MPLSPIDLLPLRTGHFVLESGHHGRLWADVDLLFTRPARLQVFVRALGERLLPHGPEAFCGPSAGWALIAHAIAQTYDLEFFWAEPRRATDGVSYEIPASLRTRIAGKRIAIVDDIINAGSAVRSTHDDIHRSAGVCVAIGALASLGRAGAAIAKEMRLPLETLAYLPNELWSPLECPLCERGVPLDR